LLCLVRLDADIYNGGDVLSCLVRLEVDIYNGSEGLSRMVRHEVDIYCQAFTSVVNVNLKSHHT
jgi:hypothetical protein